MVERGNDICCPVKREHSASNLLKGIAVGEVGTEIRALANDGSDY